MAEQAPQDPQNRQRRETSLESLNRQMQPRSWVAWLWLVPLVVIGLYWLSAGQAQNIETLSYSEFRQEVSAGNIETVVFEGDRIRGTYQAAGDQPDETGPGGARPEGFTTVMPSVEDAALLELLNEHDVTVRAESTDSGMWQMLLIGVLPWVLLLGLIFWSVRMQQRMFQGTGQGGGGPFQFARSKARRFEKQTSEVTFDDVAGVKNAKNDLYEIVDYLKDPGHYRKLNAKIPNGILMMGPPGTGKTLLAKAVAGEAEVPFFSISGSEFIEMFVGVGAARVRDMFQQAKQEAPAIIFIDELDSIGRARGAGLGGGHDEREQTLNQILNEMDGFAPYEDVVVLAATNRPDVLDSALMRPGRFDRKVTLELPDREARRRILEVHTHKTPLGEDIDLDTVARRTVGFSGADIENLVNEAGLLAGRENAAVVSMAMFEQAREKIVLGAERETALDDKEKEIIAYHESGHALVAWLLPDADPLEKVTIIPRGRALGATAQTPDEDRYNFSSRYLRARLAVMLGGRVAERLVFDDITSGAQSDLKQATELAQRMICQWGMSEKLGPVTFRRGEEHVFLGRELAQHPDFSDHTARLIDEEVHRLLTDIQGRDEELLAAHRDKLDALAQALLEHETLSAEDIRRLFKEQTGKAAPTSGKKAVNASS